MVGIARQGDASTRSRWSKQVAAVMSARPYSLLPVFVATAWPMAQTSSTVAFQLQTSALDNFLPFDVFFSGGVFVGSR
jgi:hypothetical protein